MNPVKRTQASAARSPGVSHSSLTSQVVTAGFHSNMCSEVRSCWHKEDVMLDPRAPYLFTTQVAHSKSRARVEGFALAFPAAAPFTPADGCEQKFLFKHQLVLLPSTALSVLPTLRQPPSSLLHAAPAHALCRHNSP